MFLRAHFLGILISPAAGGIGVSPAVLAAAARI
jgi:hypothetical protein